MPLRSHRQSSLVGICVVLALLPGVLATLSLWAQDVLPSQAPPQAGVVVLNDLRIVSGTVEEVSGGYRVTAPGQDIVIPFTALRLTATSTAQAYEKLRDNTPHHTVETRLALAHWCLENGLPAQAHDEVTAALVLDPLRSEARELFQRIEREHFPERTLPSPRPGPDKQPFENGPRLNSSGLSRTAMEAYVTRVQPLLMNRCGNVKCHGQGGDASFRLVNTRLNSPNHRSATESNVATILRFIDFEKPEASPLLTRPAAQDESHGLFAGETGQVQLALLREFVKTLSREVPPPGNSLVKRDPQPTAPPALQPVPAGGARPAGFLESAQLPPAAALDRQKLLERVRYEMQPDAFDPAEFNRKVHGIHPAP